MGLEMGHVFSFLLSLINQVPVDWLLFDGS